MPQFPPQNGINGCLKEERKKPNWSFEFFSSTKIGDGQLRNQLRVVERKRYVTRTE